MSPFGRALLTLAVASVAFGLAQPASAATLLASDTAASESPRGFWGDLECASQSRHQLIPSGGDPHPTATGAPQGNGSFRRVSVIDGDDYWGERCELGDDSPKSPTTFYRDGQRRITQISLRLPSPGFPLGVDTWQTVIQMKQTGPAANSGGTPVLELSAFEGSWRLRQSKSRGAASDSRHLWTAPASYGTWTRFSFDIRYSSKRSRGFVAISADLNGDGDFSDPGEASPRVRTYTLKIETPGGGRDRTPPGRSLISHLSTGIYHDSAIPCLPPLGCYMDIDNVQILRP